MAEEGRGCLFLLLLFVGVALISKAWEWVRSWPWMVKAGGVMVFGTILVVWWITKRRNKPAPPRATSHGSAAWGTVRDMMSSHIAPKAQWAKYVRRGPAVLVLGRVNLNGDKATESFDNRFFVHDTHVLTIAPTGAGKGVGAVIPNLLDYPGSAFILDVKGENYAVTADARRRMEQAVYLLDPFSVTGEKSPKNSFNPLDRLDPSSPDVVGESAALVDMLVITNERERGDHWTESAKDLLRGLAVYVAATAPQEKRNLGEIRRLLTSAPDEWRKTLENMSFAGEMGCGMVARSANVLAGKPEKERGSVVSTAQRHTAFLDDPRISASLSKSDFSFDWLKREPPISVYLAIPMDKIESQSRFLRVVFGAAQSAVMASSDQPTSKVLFLLDEFGQLGYMPNVETGVSLLRGYGGMYWLFVQDLGQLKPVYPKWQSIMANTAKHVFGTADLDTAKYISESLGNTTVQFETKSNNSHNSSSGWQSSSGSGSATSQQYAARALLTPDEVMRKSRWPLILIAGQPPFWIDRLTYYIDPDYSGKAAPNPFRR